MTAILKHELKSYFHSLTAYVFGAFLLVMVGFGSVYYNLMAAVSNFEYVLSFGSIIFVIIVPLLTMRVIAEERRQSAEMLAELQALRAQLGQNAPEDGAAPVPDSAPAAQPETPQTDTTESAPEPAETK